MLTALGALAGTTSCGDKSPDAAGVQQKVSALSSGRLLVRGPGSALRQPTIYQLFYGDWWNTSFGQTEMSDIKGYVTSLVGYINGQGAPTGQVPMLRQYGVLSASAPTPPAPMADNIGSRINVGMQGGKIDSPSGATAHVETPLGTAPFTSNQVGGSITFTGAATAINNASFTILSVEDSRHVTIRPGQNDPLGAPVPETFGSGVNARISRPGLVQEQDIANIIASAQNQNLIPAWSPDMVVMIWMGYDLEPNTCDQTYAPPAPDANCTESMWGTFHRTIPNVKQAYGTVFERPGRPTSAMFYYVGHEIIEALTDPYIDVNTGWEGMFDYATGTLNGPGTEICDSDCGNFNANGILVPGMIDNTQLGCTSTGYISGWFDDNAPTGPASAFNLASKKPVQALFLDGSQAVMQPGSTPAAAVDGDPSTFAQATNQWRWQLQIDLLDVQFIDTVRVTMPTTTFATALHVDTSADGSNFTTAATSTGLTGGGPQIISFTARTARYVRIVADKPDGPGQTGGQMALSEVGVFGPPDLALHKTAVAQYINGGTAVVMQPGSLPAFAVDGDSSTFAQASNQYRWQLEVEVGANARPINMALLQMPASAYATSYHVDFATSMIGTAKLWSTAATITNGAPGTAAIPLSGSARWVRVVADKPDGPGQTGGQMAISRLSLFGERDRATGATFTAEYLDGSPATMQSPVSDASDGNTRTWAQATNQFLWRMKVDWGAPQSVSQVDVLMPPEGFATAFHVDFSANGTSWTQVASVSSRVFGGVVQTTFPTQTARAIRIVADQPNSANLLGGQMGIAEVVVSR